MKTALDLARQRAEALEPIPPITDPMGKYWEQPDRREILIDDTHAVMTQRTFDKLAAYSASVPTGVYEGKMWKSNPASDRGGKPEWYLIWFGKHPDPDKVSNNYRRILVVGASERAQ